MPVTIKLWNSESPFEDYLIFEVPTYKLRSFRDVKKRTLYFLDKYKNGIKLSQPCGFIDKRKVKYWLEVTIEHSDIKKVMNSQFVSHPLDLEAQEMYFDKIFDNFPFDVPGKYSMKSLLQN